MISAFGIHKYFIEADTSLHVIKNVSLSVRENEFIAIMGKSGAGKSTLMYQLSALDKPSEGSITVAGTDILALNEDELTIFRLNTLGYVFQDYALILDLTAFENVILPLLMRNMKWDEAENLAHTALERVGLETRYTHLPNKMSGGEQQRVAIARAIAGRPKILFADEPTANLDSVSGRRIIDLLAEINQSGQTVVMVTHEAEYTDKCNRIIFLEDGVITHEDVRDTTPEYRV
ncbi:ABC transporter ATP-binding protein [Candidatus Kaiserbacteria bacterium]|nr:MAG: ABC transporter ATP-binding protein [Candidatus Kaiserbacteria bacterium]